MKRWAVPSDEEVISETFDASPAGSRVQPLETAMSSDEVEKSVTSTWSLPALYCVSAYRGITENIQHSMHECAAECTPNLTSGRKAFKAAWKVGISIYLSTFPSIFITQYIFLFFLSHVMLIMSPQSWRPPFVPAFHSPGWLLRYLLGPHDAPMLEKLAQDMIAGMTVALTLIPQSLSYASLANLPPINGLYSSILPSAAYIILGTSMQLAVGPVAIVSLLMGKLITEYGAQPESEDAVHTAAQAALCVGILLCGMALFNMGVFIRFISHPVMSGFTTAAAMLIGLSQLKSAFGFTVPVPQIGMDDGHGHVYHYNYEIMEW